MCRSISLSTVNQKDANGAGLEYIAADGLGCAQADVPKLTTRRVGNSPRGAARETWFDFLDLLRRRTEGERPIGEGRLRPKQALPEDSRRYPGACLDEGGSRQSDSLAHSRYSQRKTAPVSRGRSSQAREEPLRIRSGSEPSGGSCADPGRRHAPCRDRGGCGRSDMRCSKRPRTRSGPRRRPGPGCR